MWPSDGLRYRRIYASPCLNGFTIHTSFVFPFRETKHDVFMVGYILTHWGRVTHICVIKLGHHWFRYWLVACSAPSHYLNQCWNIVNWTFRNKLQWNFNRNSNIFIQVFAFENVVRKMAFILSRPQWVNHMTPSLKYKSCHFGRTPRLVIWHY